MLNLKEFIAAYYEWAGEFAQELHDAENYDGRRVVNCLLDDLYIHYAEKELAARGWTKINFNTPESFPFDGQDVTYFFQPFGTMHDGQYEDGTFFSNCGFCDCHDAPYWKPRDND